MNCFDYMASAKKYADAILKEYQILIRLDSSKANRGKSFQKHLEKLQELVELEDLFYSKLSLAELDFIETQLLKKDVTEDLTIFDYSFTELDYEIIEELEWNRVEHKLSLERIRKTYPDHHFSKEQIGMVYLPPSDLDNELLEWLSRDFLLKGRFNMVFTSRVLDSHSKYSDFTKVQFIYISAYSDSAVEKYYISHEFSIAAVKSQSFQDALYSAVLTYQSDSGNYSFLSQEFFSSVFSGDIGKVMQYEDEKLESSTCLLLLSILKDGLSAFAQVAPFQVSSQICDSILKWDGNYQVKEYLVHAMQDVLSEESAKAKRFMVK